MIIAAIDPGEHNGFARFHVYEDGVNLHMRPVTLSREDLYHELVSWQYHAIVIEEFRLYPWMARTQGFSTLPTVEVIGTVKYIAEQLGVPCYTQRADIKKKARQIGVDNGWDMKERMLGTGKGRYRGPDLNLPGEQHPRDAWAHGIHWAYTHGDSPYVKWSKK